MPPWIFWGHETIAVVRVPSSR